VIFVYLEASFTDDNPSDTDIIQLIPGKIIYTFQNEIEKERPSHTEMMILSLQWRPTINGFF
jgi:hypothetical protein